jgi:hypothetical protein
MLCSDIADHRDRCELAVFICHEELMRLPSRLFETGGVDSYVGV